jgi:5-(carboxyamino)imidazole ribonucleotide synthase
MTDISQASHSTKTTQTQRIAGVGLLRTLGVLGGGQLGRMFCHAAQQMGFKTVVLDSDSASPAGLIAHEHIHTGFSDHAGLARLAAACDAITTEFENVPAQSLELLANTRPVHPSHSAVRVCQDRSLEKQWFADCDVPCAPNVTLRNEADCLAADVALFPAILKTATLGYDGKGQVSVQTKDDLLAAWQGLGGVRCVLEKKLALAFEVSVIVARGTDGAIVNLPVQQNHHVSGILAITQVPAPNVNAAQAEQAVAAAKAVAEKLNYVGVLCIEFFVLADGSLVANELAPRPHNSGHYSIEACDVSQYQLQVRTLAGLPLTQPRLTQAAVMVNVLGDVWFEGTGAKALQREPHWASVLAISGASLHLYGKAQPKIARKMGHITVTADTLDGAKIKAQACCALLGLPDYFA